MLCKIHWRINKKKQNKLRSSPQNKIKNTLYSCFTGRLKFNSFLVEYLPGIRRIKGLIENGRVKLRKVQVEP